jgi:CRP/FNR family nitrogen fixation transcriptional regulator
MLLQGTVDQNLLFAGCPELFCTPVAYGQDEEIYGEAEEAEFVYKVASGAVRTLKLLKDGRRQIGAFHFRGDLFGLQSGPTHKLTAQAVTDARVMFVKRSTLERVAMDNTEVADELLSVTVRRLEQAEEHVLLLGRKTAGERVAAFLLEMERRLPSTAAIGLPMTRRDIADYLGLAVETVSRAITNFEDEGLVTRSKAREIGVQGRSKLHKIDSDFVVCSRGAKGSPRERSVVPAQPCAIGSRLPRLIQHGKEAL